MSKDTVNVTFENEKYEICLKRAKELGLLKTKDKFSGEKLKEYYHVNPLGSAIFYNDNGDSIDEELFKIGNYFETKKQAELMSENTYDIWFKIRAWAVRNNVVVDFDLEHYVFYDTYTKKWYYGSHNDGDQGQTFMSKENCVKLCKILNEGNYRP